MIKHIANFITGCRILGSVFLLFFPTFSAEFYTIYILCGISDMMDGTVARMTNSADESGAKLDTVSDLVFVTASFIKLLPTITLPLYIWIWGIVIFVIKTSNFIRVFISKKQSISPHTLANKFTGIVLFLFPFTFPFADVKYSAAIVCFAATFAAIQEWLYITKENVK